MYILFSNNLHQCPCECGVTDDCPAGVWSKRDGDCVFLKMFASVFKYLNFSTCFFLLFLLILIQGCFSTVVKGGTQGNWHLGLPKYVILCILKCEFWVLLCGNLQHDVHDSFQNCPAALMRQQQFLGGLLGVLWHFSLRRLCSLGGYCVASLPQSVCV